MPSFQPNTIVGPGFHYASHSITKNKPRMYKRKYVTNTPVPMQMAGLYSRNTSTYRKRRRTSARGGAGYSGPYRTLTLGNRHTNPVYPKPEVKFLDSTQLGTVFTVTPASSAMPVAGLGVILNKIVQNGSTPGRIGARVAIKSCAYRFEVDLGPTPVACSGRVVLLWDKQPNAETVYAWTDVFSVASYLSYMDVGNTLRFTILRNQQFSLSPNGDQNLFFEGYCKINMESVWPQGVATATTPTSGALVLLYISDQTTVANQPLLTGVWRVRYIDS